MSSKEALVHRGVKTGTSLADTVKNIFSNSLLRHPLWKWSSYTKVWKLVHHPLLAKFIHKYIFEIFTERSALKRSYYTEVWKLIYHVLLAAIIQRYIFPNLYWEIHSKEILLHWVLKTGTSSLISRDSSKIYFP